MALDGDMADLTEAIEHDAKIEFISRDDPRALETDPPRRRARACRAVQSLWPGTQVTIGPVIEKRLLLRFLPQRAVHAGRFCRDREGRCARSSRATNRSPGSVGSRKDQTGFFATRRETSSRAGRRHSRRTSRSRSTSRATGSISAAARIFDLDRKGRQRLQVDEGGGCLLARRFEQSDADAHLRHGVRQAGRPRCVSEQIEEPKSATIANWGANSICFTSRKKAPAWCSGTRRAGPSSRRDRYMRRRLTGDYSEVNAPQILDKVLVGNLRPLGLVPRGTCSPPNPPATRLRTSAGLR